MMGNCATVSTTKLKGEKLERIEELQNGVKEFLGQVTSEIMR
jgi:hypothetical protein